MKLTTHLSVVQRLRMSGAVPLFPLGFHSVERDSVLYSACHIFCFDHFNYLVTFYKVHRPQPQSDVVEVSRVPERSVGMTALKFKVDISKMFCNLEETSVGIYILRLC